MLALDERSKVALCDDIVLREVPGAGQYYAFNVENGDHFALNQTAYWALEAAGPGMAVGDLVEAYAEEFQIERDQATEELRKLVAFGYESHILREVE